MEDNIKEVRRWDELIPDVLGLIFLNLPFEEVMTVVPRVCKSWGRAVAGPYCWKEIDIEEWSKQCTKPEILDRMLHMLVTRSAGSVQRINVSGLSSDSTISFIADHAGSLKTLELPRSEISDTTVEQVAGRLANITFLDLSYCKKIGPRALEAIGNHCKSLVGLRRRMHPLEVADKVCQDDEAHAIACTMPRLRHLEMAYLLLTTRGIDEILSQCKELEYLDIRGCWEVELEDKVVKEKYTGLRVLGPHIFDCYERNYLSDYSDYYSDSSHYDWEFMDGDSEDEFGNNRFEMRFYGSGSNSPYSGFEWPSSP